MRLSKSLHLDPQQILNPGSSGHTESALSLDH